MRTKIIFGVCAAWQYETSDVFVAFRKKELADNLVAAIKGYDKTHPLPGFEGRWRENHPAGEFSGRDFYTVVEIPLKG
jgi:hypothetical protein